MKIRIGFVSNSSSSSFIIKDANKSLNLDEIKEIIVQKVYDWYQDEKIRLKNYYDKNENWRKHDEERYSTLENIRKWIDVSRFSDYDYKSFMLEFFRKLDDTDIIISDNDDNYFAEDIKEWIEDNFDINQSCWHCG